MSEAMEIAKSEWVKRVLGFEPPGAAARSPRSGFQRQWQAAVQAWESAANDVNAQIEKLAGILRAANNKTLNDIAEYGLNGVTGDHVVRLRAAFIDIGRAGDDVATAVREKAAHLVEDFEDHLRNDQRVALTEANPFRVPVPIGARLVPALSDLRKILTAA